MAGFVALRFVRFPLLSFPEAFVLSFISMDLTPLLYGRPEFSWDQRLWMSLWFGLAMMLASYFVDRRTEEDFAFWGCLFGMIAFWGGLSLMRSESESPSSGTASSTWRSCSSRCCWTGARSWFSGPWESSATWTTCQEANL